MLHSRRQAVLQSEAKQPKSEAELQETGYEALQTGVRIEKPVWPPSSRMAMTEAISRQRTCDAVDTGMTGNGSPAQRPGKELPGRCDAPWQGPLSRLSDAAPSWISRPWSPCWVSPWCKSSTLGAVNQSSWKDKIGP
jgi:hypothetical protein